MDDDQRDSPAHSTHSDDKNRDETDKRSPSPPTPSTPTGGKQCRICFDGEDPDLGRLIRPCLCKGSISHVHVKCLQQWRNTSRNQDAFFQCQQCHYRYNFQRTKVFGIAENPVIIGTVAAVLFTVLVLLSSFVTTYLLRALEDPYEDAQSSTSSLFYYSTGPLSLGYDLLRAVLRILRDKDESGALGALFDGYTSVSARAGKKPPPAAPRPAPGFLRRFVARFLLGLPVVGVGSLVSMLLTLPIVAPLQWIARYRGQRRNRDTSDIAAVIVVVLIVVGAAKTLVKVYEYTQKLAKRLLLRAEDAILEVQ